MLIACPNCEINYSARNATCPRCKSFETPRDVRTAYWNADAVERLHEGSRPDDVRAELIAAGFPDAHADEIIRSTRAQIKGENRRFGFIRLLVGIAMICFGTLAVGVVLFSFRPGSSVRLGGRTIAFLLFGGGAMYVSGVLALVSGALATLTGREPRIGPPSHHQYVDD